MLFFPLHFEIEQDSHPLLPGSALGIELVQEFSLPLGCLCVSVGSVERFTGDAIVNAANEACGSDHHVEAKRSEATDEQ